MALFASKETFFEIQELAGEGLNSRVYKALRKDASRSISQVVALKILKSKNAVPFWRQEVHSLLQVNSPYCVRFLDFEWVNDLPALVLEWLEGVTLTQLYRSQILTTSEALEIALQVQEGLVDLHMAQLCHGDLHMDNIFIEKSGEVKLLDFGMANVSRYKSQGSPTLRAPELSNQGAPSFWSDLFSLGILCKELGISKGHLSHSDPQQRDLLSGQRCLKAKISIANKVQNLIQRKEVCAKQKTLCLSERPSKKANKWLQFLSATFVFPIFMTLNPSRASHQPCVVEIKTKAWHLVGVNRGKKQYAPARFLLKSCKGISVQWQNAKNSGEIFSQTESNVFIRLTDKDFVLDH